VRLNGTSDIAWERVDPDLFQLFSGVQFYDYTKSPQRMRNYLTGLLPENYHLTFSRTESNEPECSKVLARGGNVAVCFATLPPLGIEYLGAPVVNGDAHDLRFQDRSGVVVGLTAKGRAKHDRTGFTVRV
jgi:hypothetical protein